DLFDEEFLRKLESLSVMNKHSVSGARRGERRSRKKGSGVEFADHRNYVAGDDIRYLDWGVYQRFGKLLLRLFEEEEDLSLYFLVDTSASMGMYGAAKLNQAAQVTAALCYLGLSSLDRVSICTISDRITGRMAPTRGKQRVFRALHFLSQMQGNGVTDLKSALRAFVAQNKRRGMVILMSDLFDPAGFQAGIDVLRFNKFEPVVLHLTDARDQASTLLGDLSLTDVESGVEREVTMTRALKQRVQLAFVQRQQDIAHYCGKKGVPYFEVDVATPFADVVLNVLRKGGLLR
ncbi:MAG TPA: DUF58 domain-containing protein, partial [Polyangiaceae bacterium]|nr:DUF58 domain-containing protein [Polyangiaceae bacterium]